MATVEGKLGESLSGGGDIAKRLKSAGIGSGGRGASSGAGQGKFLFATMDIEGLNDRYWAPRDYPYAVALGAMLNVEREIIEDSPVVTRRFVASWIATVGSPSTQDPISRTQQLAYRSSGKKFRRKASFQGKTAWKATKESIKQGLWLVNNVPYAGNLREGGSPYSVPPGWLEAAIKRGLRSVSSRSVKTIARKMR